MFRNQLGEKFFRAFGHGMFLVPEEATPAGTEFCITFTQLPAAWSFVSSFGAGQEAGRASYVTAVGHDTLRNSVFLGGDFRVERREIEGRPLYVALRGSWPFDDGKFADATATLIGAQRRFFGDFDYPHFVISLVPNRVTQGSSTGGTAVYNAFAMHASKDFTVPGRSFEYLIGHEHLHTWIATRIGAQGEEADQPQRYWFSEGFTDYLTHRLLLAAGMWTLEDFAAGMNRVMERYFTSSARSASNARVLKEFWTDAEVGQIPYLRGELLAWRWDAALRRRDATLDGVLKSLVLPRDKLPASDSGDPKDFATARLQTALKPLLGAELERDMAAYIERGDTLPVGAAFLGPCFTRTVESKIPFQLGFDSAGIALRRVQGVIAGSAAERAGLRDGMELVGWSIHFGDTGKDVVAQVRDDDGQVRNLTYRPVTAEPVEVPVFKVKPGAAEDGACRAWTGR
jgi:predicted metalloprotease with PDZ domain